MVHGRLGVAFTLSGAHSLQKGHETSIRGAVGRRADVGMDDFEEGGQHSRRDQSVAPSPAGGEQHSEVSKIGFGMTTAASESQTSETKEEI